MARAVWKGHISFGLVNVPITLYPAEERSDLHFRQIDSENNARVRYSRVNEETGEEVPWERIVKGYEYDRGDYVLLDRADFEQVAAEATRTIEIEQFVDAREVETVYFDKPYYLVPGKAGEKGYVLLREALRRNDRMGIARVVIRSRQYLAGLIAAGDALLLDLLRYHHEIRTTEQFDLPRAPISDYRISDREIGMAEQLVESMADEWRPAAYKDEYRDRLYQYIEAKAQSPEGKAHAPAPAEEPAAGGEVIDMMDLLKRSVQDRDNAGKARDGGGHGASRKKGARASKQDGDRKGSGKQARKKAAPGQSTRKRTG